MSGNSYNSTCPNCGDENVDSYNDWKPFDTVSHECLICGWCAYTNESQATLEEVNERRADLEMEPLTELKKVNL